MRLHLMRSQLVGSKNLEANSKKKYSKLLSHMQNPKAKRYLLLPVRGLNALQKGRSKNLKRLHQGQFKQKEARR
jgi:hypothetical protein